MSDRIRIEQEAAVAWITINRPETLNALDMDTLADLRDAVEKVEQDNSVRVVVFTGAGDRAFVAGGDIADLNSRQGLAHYLELGERLHTVFRAIEEMDKPTISAINGWALGGGTELLLSTDLRIAVETARFGLPEIKLGLFPGAGGTQRLLRQVPACKAREMMFTGQQLSAVEAERIGLINRVVPTGALREEVDKTASSIAAMSPLVLKLLKRTLRDGDEMPLRAALRHEQAMIGLVLDTPDAHEGCSAFIEKRLAKF